MERAILFFDIDGTVLSEVTKEVPQSAIEAMEKARAEGHLLFINTGRTICSIPTEVRKFQFDGYLCGCGTYLTEHDEVLLKSSIEKQRGIELLRKAKECNLGVIAEGQEDCYFPGHISRFDRLESTRRYFASRGIGIEQSLESERFEYDKLFVYVDDKSDFDSFREYLGDDMDASHAYVFGDSSNDLAMFEYAEHAIAMGRHDSVLDSYAEFVTKTVENDGIAYAMKHYGLI